MSISAIVGGLPPISGVGQSASISGASAQISGPKNAFEDQLSSMLQGVDQAQHGGDVALQDLAAGDAGIHETMIALTQADITLQAASTARNKVVSAYETIMNMAI
ncbi:MAG: flagellar hook-basal body complex protein FliE [Cognaticolwellia sp.]|jgi:flagellar hook-basal body complex protein FliE